MSDSLWPHGPYSPWNSPDQNTGVGSLSLLQGVFPIQELNWGLLHCRQIIYQLSYQGSPQFSQPITPKKLAEKSIQYLLLLSLSHIWLLVTPWIAAFQASLFFTISWNLLKLMSIESVMPYSHPVLCYPLLFLPSISPSIKVFSNESHQVAKVLELQLQHQSFQWTLRTDLL